MADKKKEQKINKSEQQEITSEQQEITLKQQETTSEQKINKNKSEQKINKNKSEQKIKYKIGSIVFISKDADADLNGFKLFPQYKKYAYTVEAYEPNTGVYTLRKLNLSLRLKEELILAPSERAHDSINRTQY